MTTAADRVSIEARAPRKAALVLSRRECLAALALLVAGCSTQVEPPPGPTGPLSQPCPSGRTCDFEMELGTGLVEFEPLDDGAEVVVVQGPQGGFHIWLSTRCRSCAEQVIIEYGVRGTADDAWLLGTPLRGVVNMDEQDGWQQALGLYGLLPGKVGEVDFSGLDVVLEANIEDGERRSSRRVPVHVRSVEVWDCPESDPESCAP